jgi:hypothetical protein
MTYLNGWLLTLRVEKRRNSGLSSVRQKRLTIRSPRNSTSRRERADSSPNKDRTRVLYWRICKKRLGEERSEEGSTSEHPAIYFCSNRQESIAGFGRGVQPYTARQLDADENLSWRGRAGRRRLLEHESGNQERVVFHQGPGLRRPRIDAACESTLDTSNWYCAAPRTPCDDLQTSTSVADRRRRPAAMAVSSAFTTLASNFETASERMRSSAKSTSIADW